MKQYSVPLCYFPSTILFIDDNHTFLKPFTLQLPETLVYQLFDSPRRALNHIERNKRYHAHVTDRCNEDVAEELLIHRGDLHVELAPLYAEIYNPCRFQEITVVVIDVADIQKDGFAICRQIEALPLLKILITDTTQEAFALDAFNQGLVQCVVNKDEPNATTELHQRLQQLQNRYFLKMSEYIVKALQITSPTSLHDDVFIEFFNQLCEDTKTVEFYLTDLSGSFLLVNQQGVCSTLVVCTEADLDAFCMQGRTYGATEDMIERVSKRQQIPVFKRYRAESIDARWVDGRERYYYALLDTANADPAVQFTSYQDYLDSADVINEVIHL